MNAPDLIPTLALITFAATLGFLAWRYVKIDKKIDD